MSTIAVNTIAEHWIDGIWSTGDGQSSVETISPATGESVGRVPEGGEAECRAAIDAAKRAFERTDWPQNPRLRAAVLLSAAAKIEDKKEPLADLLSRETGKTTKRQRPPGRRSLAQLFAESPFRGLNLYFQRESDLGQCDPKAKRTKKECEWLDGKPVGRELI